MRAKIKATGEIVELNEQGISLFEYARGIYKDVNGNKYRVDELEFIEENPEKDIDWEHRRFDIAKNCIIGILGNDEMVDLANGVGLKKNCRDIPTNVAEMAVALADALIAELKKGGEK